MPKELLDLLVVAGMPMKECPPSLEELIEVCGENIKTIDFLHDKNEVVAYSADSFDFDRNGLNATEAVAKLWLALNKK